MQTYPPSTTTGASYQKACDQAGWASRIFPETKNYIEASPSWAEQVLKYISLAGGKRKTRKSKKSRKAKRSHRKGTRRN